MSAISPTKNTGLIVDDFIAYATQHLTTVGGTITTTSLYPPAGTPAPGILTWTGYFVDPATPSQQSPNFKMSEEEIAGAKEDLASAQNDLQTYESEGNEEAAQTAREQIALQENKLASGENYSVDGEDDVRTLPVRTELPLDGGVTNPIETAMGGTPTQPNESYTEPTVTETEIGKRIVAFAIADIGTLENPLPPGKPENWGPRVSQMLNNVGFKTPAYWCAAAVTTWYKAAGAKYPKSGGASCDVWMSWGKKNGLFSTKPAIGAAILYGTSADAHHIGIVQSIEGGKVKTIEGNTSGGGFSRNGVGVFKKTPNLTRIVGYVLPQKA